MNNKMQDCEKKIDFTKYFNKNDALDICNTLETKLNEEERKRFFEVMEVRFEVAKISHGLIDEVDQVKMANELIKLCSDEKLDMQKIEDKYKRIALGSSNRLGSSAFVYMFGTRYFETILPFVENDVKKVYVNDKNKAKEIIDNYRKIAQNFRLNQQLGE